MLIFSDKLLKKRSILNIPPFSILRWGHLVTLDIVVGDVSYKAARGVNDTFWNLMNSRHWEPETLSFFRTHICEQTLVLDVGAWIGPTALYAAQLGKKCVAFEPDPIAFSELQTNFQANEGADWLSRLEIVNAAITADGSPIRIGSQAAGGDSMSSALFAEGTTSWVVNSYTLQSVIQKYSEPSQPVFIKIDIEGGEYELVPTVKDLLARPGVTIHLSLHPRFLRKALRKQFKNIPFFLRFLAVRAAFVKKHAAVLSALPIDKQIAANSRVPTWLLLPVAALLGRFPREIRITETNRARST